MTIDHLVRVGQVSDGSMGNIICPSAGESLGKLGVGSSYMSADDCAPLPYIYTAYGAITCLFGEIICRFGEIIYICSSGESV